MEFNLNMYFCLILGIFSLIPIYFLYVSHHSKFERDILENSIYISYFLLGISILVQLIFRDLKFSNHLIENSGGVFLILALILQGIAFKRAYLPKTEKLPQNIIKRKVSVLNKLPVLIGMMGITVWNEFGNLAVWKFHAVVLVLFLGICKGKEFLRPTPRVVGLGVLLFFPLYAQVFNIPDVIKLNSLYFLSLIGAIGFLWKLNPMIFRGIGE